MVVVAERRREWEKAVPRGRGGRSCGQNRLARHTPERPLGCSSRSHRLCPSAMPVARVPSLAAAAAPGSADMDLFASWWE